MSDRLLWLSRVLRSAGLDVYEMPGWETRGVDRLNVQGVVWHHTATSIRWQDGHVAALLRDGRRDLTGPLSQLGLERDGTFVVVASGRANHNGYGRWGNDSIGIEAYNDGIGEPWPQVQLDAYHIGTAAILAHLGWGADRVLGHRETDPGRKIDPTGIDMDAARKRINGLAADLIHSLRHPEEAPMELLYDTRTWQCWVHFGGGAVTAVNPSHVHPFWAAQPGSGATKESVWTGRIVARPDMARLVAERTVA